MNIDIRRGPSSGEECADCLMKSKEGTDVIHLTIKKVKIVGPIAVEKKVEVCLLCGMGLLDTLGRSLTKTTKNQE